MVSRQKVDVPTAARARRHPVHLLAYGLIVVAAGLLRVRDLGGFVTVDEQARWIQRVSIFMQALASGTYGATAITRLMA